MQIPIAIHKDENRVYGVTVPDSPGCSSWGDSVEDALNNVREAICAHIDSMLNERLQVDIAQSRIEDLAANEDYSGAAWAWVEVDLSKFD